jgi:hypothetical protein
MSVTRSTAFDATIRAARIAKAAANRGDLRRARRAWTLACDFAWQTGGLSGADASGKVLLVTRFDRSYTVWAPRGI